MEGEQEWLSDASLNIPLIQDHERRQISDIGPNNNNVTTSFLKTCFNGLNALSGNLINLSCLMLHNTSCF